MAQDVSNSQYGNVKYIKKDNVALLPWTAELRFSGLFCMQLPQTKELFSYFRIPHKDIDVFCLHV